MSLKPWERGATILIEAVAVSRAIQECSNEIKRLQTELAEWEKLKDPINLHLNLLRGIPAQLSKSQLKHLLGDEQSADAAVADFKQRAIEA